MGHDDRTLAAEHDVAASVVGVPMGIEHEPHRLGRHLRDRLLQLRGQRLNLIVDQEYRVLTDEERDIVTYVRQLMRTNRVDQTVFDRLKNRHDAQWMVELTEVANYFAFLSGMVNPFEVPAPPDGDKLPS